MLPKLVLFLLIFWSSNLQACKATLKINGTDEDVYHYPTSHWSQNFDWQLFQNVSSSSEKNLIVSPLSLKISLALLFEGMTTNAQEKFANALQLNSLLSNFRSYYKSLLLRASQEQNRDNLLNLASGFFLDEPLRPVPYYASIIKRFYQSDITKVNFTDAPKAADSINKWVEDTTNGHLKSFVEADKLRNAQMLLANAVFFKGSWLHNFPVEQSSEGTFFSPPENKAKARYMNKVDGLYYKDSTILNARIVRLPYKGTQFAMFVLLPKEKDGLKSLVQSLDLEKLRSELQGLKKTPVLLTLPQFKFDDQVELLDVLDKAGVGDFLRNSKNWPYIVSNCLNLTISSILQKSGIIVNEEGSTVFSATGVTLVNKFGEEGEVFAATHPFMFFIEDQVSGTIIFAGKVVEPSPVATPATVQLSAVNLQDKYSASGGQDLNLQPIGPVQNPSNPGRFKYFDLELLHTFSDSNGNFLVSPASIKLVLSMILEGAGGASAAEIRRALRIPPGVDISQSYVQRLLNDLKVQNGATTVQTANALFVSDHYKINSDYSKRISSNFGATINPVDLSNPSVVAGNINAWVSRTTNGLIRDLVTPGSLTGEKALLVVNALYFKGEWLKKFEEKNTAISCFRSFTKDCVHVNMMRTTNTFDYGYIQNLDAQAVVLPYKDNVYAMLVLLPSEHNTVQILSRDLQHNGLEMILSQLESMEIFLELPKFDMDFSGDVVDYLRQMKIQSVFGSNSNLSGIVEKESLKVGNFIHKTKLLVNEEGSEAAAASGAVVIPLMGSPMPKMVVNRPFIFFIYHKASGDILFEGQLVEPKEVENSAIPSSLRTRRPTYNGPWNY